MAESVKALGNSNRGVNRMKKKILKIIPIIVSVLSCICTLLVAVTYPRYYREMSTAHDRLLAGSKILKTNYGDIEFAARNLFMSILFISSSILIMHIGLLLDLCNRKFYMLKMMS